MTRTDQERLSDILAALDRCLRFRPHLDSGDNTTSDMALDAILRNLAVVGEAAKMLSEQTRALFSSTPWHSIAGLRNIVVHEYFRIDNKIILDVVDSEVTPLVVALRSYLSSAAAGQE